MRAEYDRRNNRVVSIEMNDGRVVGTDAPRQLGAPTEWLPIKVIYPEGYDPRFHQLLQPRQVRYHYNELENAVEVHYPAADFSPSAIRDMLRESIRTQAQNVLQQSDWQVIREVENSKRPMSKEVRAERQAVRDRSNELEAELDNVPDDELSDFTFLFAPEEEGMPVGDTGPTVEAGDGTEWVTDAQGPDEHGNPVRPARYDEQSDIAEERLRPHPMGERGTMVGDEGEAIARGDQSGTGLDWKLEDER